MNRRRRKCQKIMPREVEYRAHKGVSKWITCVVVQNLEVCTFCACFFSFGQRGIGFLRHHGAIMFYWGSSQLTWCLVKKKQNTRAQNDARQNNSQAADSVNWSHVWIGMVTRHRRKCQKIMPWEVQHHAHKGVSKWITCEITQNLEVLTFCSFSFSFGKRGVSFSTPWAHFLLCEVHQN